MSDIRLCYFRLSSAIQARKFYRYRVKNTSPYERDIVELNNQVRYKIISRAGRNNRIFVYSDREENYIYTFRKIEEIPDLSDKKAEIEFVDCVEFPVSEKPDLYEAWIEYFFYSYIKKMRKYDCHAEHHFYLNIETPKNKLDITLRRDFYMKVKIMPDGTSYVGFDISTQYFSYRTLNEWLRKGEDIVGMEVKCVWQGYDRTYKVVEVSDSKIGETVNGFNLYDYWQKEQPYRLGGIDSAATPIVYLSEPKHQKVPYIPQSLHLVFRREFVAMKDGAFSRATDKITKLPMNSRLKIMQDFLNDINGAQSAVTVSPEPVTAEEMGYHVYDAYSAAPRLLIGNGRKTAINKKSPVFSNGFYRQPSEKPVIGFIFMNDRMDDCKKAARVVIEYLEKNISAKFLKIARAYNVGDSPLKIENEISLFLDSHSDINFIVCFVPEKTDELEYADEKSTYSVVKKILADMNVPSQMISAKFLDDVSSGNDTAWYLQNVALGVLSKSGGVPWVFEEQFGDVDCFIGIDVSTQSKGIHYPACSVCFDGSGNLLGYYASARAQAGEKIDSAVLEDTFDRILLEYKAANGRYPKHIVIHRDGFSNECEEWYEEYFAPKSIIYDVVEIRKNISERLIDCDNANGMNPDSGICIVKDDTAVIVTTRRDARYGGSPKPIEIVHKKGSLNICEIARQIYSLSEYHVGSMQSTRLPMTTYYADRICKMLDYIPKGKLCNKLSFL